MPRSLLGLSNYVWLAAGLLGVGCSLVNAPAEVDPGPDGDGGEGGSGNGVSSSASSSSASSSSASSSSASSSSASSSGSGTGGSGGGGVSCGDGQPENSEACDDGNMNGGDGCSGACTVESGYVCNGAPSVCTLPCGDGVVMPPESCDDGNKNDLDACTNACQRGPITLGGNGLTYVEQALNSLAESFQPAAGGFGVGTPPGSGVFITSNDGVSPPYPDLMALLGSGGHVLLIGGSGELAYTQWVDGYVTTDGSSTWHQSSECASDWNKVGDHPITKYLPAVYEFVTSTATSYHMLHFTPQQPPGTALLGVSCDGPANYHLVTRLFPGGGTYTHMALDLGPYGDPATVTDFSAPFVRGYLEYVRSPKN